MDFGTMGNQLKPTQDAKKDQLQYKTKYNIYIFNLCKVIKNVIDDKRCINY